MSAITETEPGEEMVCVLGFSARPRGPDNEPIPGQRRTFRVGERVRYVTCFYKGTPEDNPTGYMAVFEPLESEDKNRYAATQNYFVTLDCWEGLRKHFANTLVVMMERDFGVRRLDPGTYVLIEAEEAAPRTVRKPGGRGKGVRKDA
jgi:hypothetical protein